MSRAALKRNPGRGSQRLHRALGGTRILLAAAPTAPPCFCRWQRSSLLHRGFFPAGLFGGSMLFESTRSMSLALLQNKNLSVLAYVEVFWWARVDYASRAAKNSPLGCFCAVFCDSAAAVRIHPCIPFFKADKTETPVPGSDTGVLGGRGWIRTTEAESSRFTVCPHWPLGNTPLFFFCSRVDCLYMLPLKARFVNP